MDNLPSELQGTEDPEAHGAGPLEQDLPEQCSPPRVQETPPAWPGPSQPHTHLDGMLFRTLWLLSRPSFNNSCLPCQLALMPLRPPPLLQRILWFRNTHGRAFALLTPSRPASCSHLQLLPQWTYKLQCHTHRRNISPPPDSHLAFALASLSDFQPLPDPFQGLALSGFGLPGAAGRQGVASLDSCLYHWG